MRAQSTVFNPRRYTGKPDPPASLEDLSRYERDLAVAGTTAWRRLSSGLWVLDLDGNSDYASLNVASWRDIDPAGTIEGWVNSSVITGEQTIFATSDTGTDTNFLQLRLVRTTGFLEIVQRDGGALNQITGDVGCGDGCWHHCVVTGDMAVGAWILYVDAVVQGLTVTSGANTGNWFNAVFLIRDNLSIGAMLNTGTVEYFNGSVLPARVHNYVMTPDQIYSRYQNERGWFNA